VQVRCLSAQTPDPVFLRARSAEGSNPRVPTIEKSEFANHSRA